MKVGTIISPSTGQRVLVIQQTTKDGKVWMDRGQPIGNLRKTNPKDPGDPTWYMRRMTLTGQIGDVFNYITRENYGQRKIMSL